MNITEFIQFLEQIKKLNLNDAETVDIHLPNINPDSIDEEKLEEAMNFVKELIKAGNRNFPPQFDRSALEGFMQSTPYDLIQAQKNQLIPHAKDNPNPTFFSTNNINPESLSNNMSWELSNCQMVVLGCVPVIGWLILIAYAIYHCCSTEENVSSNPHAKNC